MNTTEMLTMPKGTKLTCIDTQSSNRGTTNGNQYKFLGYDESSVPKNDLHATMTWYSSKPIWSPEDYELIRYKFMLIKLEGVSKLQWLKDFRVSS